MLLQYEQQLDDMRERVLELQTRSLDERGDKLSAARKSLLAARPDRMIVSLRENLSAAARMLAERAGNVVARREAALAGLVAKLDSLSPLAVLARGYSIAYRAGKALKSSAEASVGDRIRVRLHRGALTCAVEQVED
jgi:exodeoxyribonuclease VII large subunit